MANLYAEHAREILGLDGTYQMSCCEDLDPRKSDGRIKISMMVCPRLEDGRLAWPMAERKTKKTCTFTVAEHDAWCLAWEQRTGKCHRCSPTNPGQEWIGWSKDDGDKYRTCPRCGGTNKAPQ